MIENHANVKPRAIYKKQWYQKNKEHVLEQKKQYYLDNKEQILEQKKHYNQQHGKERNQYLLEHKDEIAKQQNQYYLENKEEILEQKEQYYLENKEEISERQKQYSKTHNGKMRSKKAHAKRKRELGYNVLNTSYIINPNFVGHHLDKDIVIFIPKEVHEQFRHRQSNQISMDRINAVSLQWYTFYCLMKCFTSYD